MQKDSPRLVSMLHVRIGDLVAFKHSIYPGFLGMEKPNQDQNFSMFHKDLDYFLWSTPLWQVISMVRI